MAARRRKPSQPSWISLALADICREQRGKADLRQLDIAMTAGVTEATVQRIESGRWPTDPATLERVMWTYGALTAYNAPPDRLWAEAVKRFETWTKDPSQVPEWARDDFKRHTEEMAEWGESVGSH